MSEATIRARIKAILEGVNGIGKVHDYERWSNRWGDFLGHFKTSGDKIIGWTISRRATSVRYGPRGRAGRRHDMRIRGYYGLDDSAATEKTFQALIESIFDAFAADGDLAGTCVQAGPLQVDLVDQRMFGSVLCHYCELTLPVADDVGWVE